MTAQALIAAPVPRDPQLVRPYVERATKWIRTMFLIFVAICGAVALIGGTIDMAGGHASTWWMSYVKAFGFTLLPSLFFLGPVGLFWGVNRSSLLALGTRAPAIPARVSQVETRHFRGAPVHMATVEFTDASGPQVANFQGPDAARLAQGETVHVLRRGTTVAVLWGDAFVMARLGPLTGLGKTR